MALGTPSLGRCCLGWRRGGYPVFAVGSTQIGVISNHYYWGDDGQRFRSVDVKPSNRAVLDRENLILGRSCKEAMLIPVGITVDGQAHRSFTVDKLWQGVAAARERQKSARSGRSSSQENATSSK